jgi:hypothetical protein
MEDSHFARILQGGGVYLSGTVAISSCTISGNTAQAVRVLMFKSSLSPDGRLTFVLLVVCRAAVSMLGEAQ